MNVVSEKWSEILDKVKSEHEVSEAAFTAWLKPLKVHSVKDNTVTIFVPSGNQGVVYINKKYTLPFKVAINEVTGGNYDVDYTSSDDITEETPVSPAVSDRFIEANLNPKYTFDTFVVGSNNEHAHAVSLAVSESPGDIFNPLFLYGGVGLGKTHLMHSIAHSILEKNPAMRVLYVTSETFTNELIDSIRNGNNTAMSKFREKYRNIDVLLVDDIQFIIGKESTQEEFFHTFNTLYGANKQIIISSDKPPAEMKTLEERIRSRFATGLTTDITQPNYETRMAILHKKEEMDGYHIDNRVLEYIATHVKSNIRELEGALNKIMSYSRLEQREVNLELAEDVLRDVISPNEKKIITPDIIIKTVADHFDVSSTELKGNKRNKKIVYPRQISMYLCREMLDIPLINIAEALGKSDHTTVIHAWKQIEKEMDISDSTTETISILKKKINPPS